MLLLSCLLINASPARADFIFNPNTGQYQVDFLNSTAGLGIGAPPFTNNVNFDHVAGTVTPSASGAYFTTYEITPTSYSDWDEVNVSGVIGIATDAQVQIVACDGLATPIAGPFVPSGGIVDISGLGLPGCIQVQILLANSPIIDQVEVTWTPLPVMLLRLDGDSTGDAGDRHCYDVDFSNSFVDNDDVVIWVPFPTGGTDSFGQSTDPVFVEASHTGLFTIVPVVVNGITVPANSVYWDAGFQLRGSAQSYQFCASSLNGIEDGSSFQFQAEAQSPTSPNVLSDSDILTAGAQPFTTTISSTPAPSTDKTSVGTIIIGPDTYVHDSGGYSPIITYRITLANGGAVGTEAVVDPIFNDNISAIFSFLGTASPNGCSMATPATAFTINDGGTLNTVTPGSEFIEWDFTGINVSPGGSIEVSYEVDYTACFGVALNSGISADNTVGITSTTTGIIPTPAGGTSGSEGVFFDLDLTATFNFNKATTGSSSESYGDSFSYQLSSSNGGAVRLDDVILVDMIPTGVELLGVTLPSQFNGTIFYSTCTTPGVCDDSATPPPMDYTAAPGDLDVGANTYWSSTPPASLSTVTWVAFYVPCLSSPYFPSPFPSECHVVNGSPVPDEVTASLQMKVLEPGDPGFPGGGSCDTFTIDNAGLAYAYEAGTSTANADPAAPIPTAPFILTNDVNMLGGPALAILSGDGTAISGPSLVTAPNGANYAFTIENSGDDTALATQATIQIPQIAVNGTLEYLSLTSVNGGFVDYSGLPSQVVVTLGDIPAGQTRTINLGLFVPNGVINLDSFTLNGTVSGSDNDGCAGVTGNASMSTSVSTVVGIEVFKSRDESIVSSGGSIHYQLTYTNVGTSPTTGTYVVDRIPDKAHFVEAYTAPATDANGNTFTCTGCSVYFAKAGSPLPPELSPSNPFDQATVLANFVLGVQTAPGVWEPPPAYASPDEISYVAYLVDDPTATPPQFGVSSIGKVGLQVVNDDDGPGGANTGSVVGTIIRNSAAVFSNELVQAIGNLVTTSILNQTGLTLEKSVSQSIVTLGEQFDWIITYYNDTSTPSTEVVITDTLPAGLTLVSVNHQWNAAALGNGALPAGSNDITANANTTVTVNPDGTTTVRIVIADADGAPTDGLRAADLSALEGGTVTIAVTPGPPLVTGNVIINSVQGCYIQ